MTPKAKLPLAAGFRRNALAHILTKEFTTLSFNRKKATIIPILKDEGAGGERDFLQFDTISLLNL